MPSAQEILEAKTGLYLCHICISHFVRHGYPIKKDETGKMCKVCMNILQPSFQNEIMKKVDESMEVYGGCAANVLSKTCPTVAMPTHLFVRAQIILATIEDANMDDFILKKSYSSNDLYTAVKEIFRSNIGNLLKEKFTEESYQSLQELPDDVKRTLYEEESGNINCHIIVNASENVSVPGNIISFPSYAPKRDRKRFRGNDPTNKQGGDPRTNADKMLKKDIEKQWQGKNAGDAKDSLLVSLLDRNRLLQQLDSDMKKPEVKKELSKWILATTKEDVDIDNCLSITAVCWRMPFYLKGRYTKARRDCSQTPFYVPSDNDKGKMVRKGVTSVEEEICPVVSKIACGGISCQNNIADEMQGPGSKVVFGMAKFHASGREDMDVRMALPPDCFEVEKANLFSKQVDKKFGSGRPFVLEIIDAKKMPSLETLSKSVMAINKVSSLQDIVLSRKTVSDGVWIKENDRDNVLYGNNDMGVGVSGLVFCESSSYKNLQSETEDKVKFYGCLCWSENEISSQEYLDEKIAKESIYPLEIHQSTPLRVLHRRAAGVRTRHVLSMKAYRIDEHWFRLSLSTTAGTYVKEFVHGDLGRCTPSISSLLGCKTDIVELDCEGIATT